MQPKTAGNWPTNLQVAICSLTETFLENNTWHFGFVTFSDPVDHAGCIVEGTRGCRVVQIRGN